MRPGWQQHPYVFINYREADEPFGAVLVDVALSARFGEDAVFRSTRSIPLGHDFGDVIHLAVRHSAVLLAVIGPRWTPTLDPGWRGRDGGATDWVHEEIIEAFRSGVRVIPVLLDVELPSEAELPADLARLARCQYVRVHHRNAERDLERLVHELAGLMPGVRARGRVESPG